MSTAFAIGRDVLAVIGALTVAVVGAGFALNVHRHRQKRHYQAAMNWAQNRPASRKFGEG